jgi:hypothetical protein
MEFGRTSIGLLSAVCIATGAGGTYLALRHKAPLEAAHRIETRLEESSAPARRQTETATAEPAPAVTAGTSRARVEEAPATAAAPPRTAPAQVAAAPPPALAPAEPPVLVAEDDSAPLPSSSPFDIDDESVRPLAAAAGDPLLYELVVAADAVIGLQLDTSLTSERARVEDLVVARVARDVRVADRVAIPAGARAYGEVTLVETGGRLRDRARLGVRFTSVVLADGTELPIQTETIYRDGDPPGRESAAKIGGGAIGGAIIGGILGGAKGAAIGGSVGAGAGTAAVAAGGRNAATLSAGTPLTIRLEEPLVVTVEH